MTIVDTAVSCEVYSNYAFLSRTEADSSGGTMIETL